MTWNFDLTDIPRGRTETRTRVVAGKSGEPDKMVSSDVFIPQYIWAATECGLVIKSNWLPQNGRDGGRWNGFTKGVDPVAWQTYVTPEHPYAVRHVPHTPQQGAYVPIIEDVGSGA